MTRVESYTYYSNGLLKEKKDKNGNITANTYDIFGRVLKTTCGEDTIAYTYDNNGNTKTIVDSTGITVRTYDKLSRVLMKSIPKVGVMTYQYDITEDIEAGHTAEKSIDARGNTVLKIFDQLGRLDTVISDGNTTTFTYDANGNKESVTYSEGGSEEYTYYDSNQLHTLTNKKEDGTILDTYIYTYDHAGNQLTKTDQAGTTTYGYDCLNRLERVLESDGIGKSYIYDGAGNRLREIVTNGLSLEQTTYTYNEQNRLLQTQSKSEEGAIETIKYTYDANGNQTYASKELLKPASPMNKPSFGMFIVGQTKPEDNPIAGYQRSFKYDRFNQMIYAANGGTASEFAYNGEGLRVSSKVNGKVTKYVYEADKVVLELNEKGLQTAKNVYGDNRLISRTVEDEIAYYFFNGHGDVTVLANDQGEVIASYTYDAFGNPKEKTGEADNPYRYAGYQYDEGTGLYYLNARMYDPITARFMQEDSYLGKGSDPLSLNRYTYCHNDPIRYIDPTGHWIKNIVKSAKTLIKSMPAKALIKSMPAKVIVGGKTVGNAQASNGRTTGNLTDIAVGLGLSEPEYYSESKTTVMINNNGKKVYFDCRKSQGVASDGTPYTIVGGKIQVGIRDMARKAGFEDTLSWWVDDNKQTNIVVQPDMKYAPVKVIRTGNEINIQAYVNFTGDTNSRMPSTSKSFSEYLTYAEIAAKGIEENWKGEYNIYGQEVTLNTVVYSNNNSPNNLLNRVKTSSKQRFLEIKLDNGDNLMNYNGMTSHVFTGINPMSISNSIEYGEKASILYDWSIKNPGTITLYNRYKGEDTDATVEEYAQVAAHEFGHILGIGDAYNASYRDNKWAPSSYSVNYNGKKYEVKVPNYDMMLFNEKVTHNDVRMVLEAWKTGVPQFFPRGSEIYEDR